MGCEMMTPKLEGGSDDELTIASITAAKRLKGYQKSSLQIYGLVPPGKEKVFHELACYLGQISQLLQLNLNYTDSGGLEDKGVEALMKEIQNMEFLSCLTLNFSKSLRITDLGLNSIVITLTRLQNLRKLELNLQEIRSIRDNEQTFGKCWEYMHSLEDLKINFGRTCVNDNLLLNLGSQLSKVEHLRIFHLNFENCFISNDGLFALAKGLKEWCSNRAKLQALGINFIFRSCREITDEGVEALTNQLFPINLLVDLNLDFGYCQHLTEDLLNKIKNHIKEKNRVQKFYLCLLGTQISPSASSKFFNAIKNHFVEVRVEDSE